MHDCFLDILKAFDLVSYDVLWEKLERAGVPTQLVCIISYRYQHKTNNEKWANTLSDQYRLKCGVRQSILIFRCPQGRSHLICTYAQKRCFTVVHIDAEWREAITGRCRNAGQCCPRQVQQTARNVYSSVAWLSLLYGFLFIVLTQLLRFFLFINNLSCRRIVFFKHY